MNITVRIVDKKKCIYYYNDNFDRLLLPVDRIAYNVEETKKKKDINHTDFQSFNLR